MTILNPIVYAGGALRLTDHGPRGGGVVLKHSGGLQADFRYSRFGSGSPIVATLDREIMARLNCNYEPEVVVSSIAREFGVELH